MKEPNLEQPILFVSDAHLGGFSEEENHRIETELIQLIDYCQQKQIQIALLGDLFDYWMEYPQYVPSLGERILERFEEFNTQMGPSLYITGNHDNWTNNHLLQRGFYLEHEQFLCAMNNKNVMLLHGDGLTDSSHGLQRPRSHKLLRNDHFIKLYQTILPPEWGLTVMKHYSRFSRMFLSAHPDIKKLNDWACRMLKNSPVDIIISGHDHVPRRKQFSFGTYINLGTFYKHRTMALYNKNTLSLVLWEPARKALEPFDSKIQ